MNNENDPNSIAEPRVSKLKKRRRTVNASNVPRQKLATILDVTAAGAAKQTNASGPNNAQQESFAAAASNKLKNDPTQSSKLGFINHLSQSELRSVMSSLIGDKQYTVAEFERAVCKAFAHRTKKQKTDNDTSMVKERIFHHPLLGEVDLCATTNEVNGELSLAFPLPDVCEKARESNGYSNMLPLDGPRKLFGNGIQIPISFCQFPSMKESPAGSVRSDKAAEPDIHILEEERIQPVSNISIEELKCAETNKLHSASGGVDAEAETKQPKNTDSDHKSNSERVKKSKPQHAKYNGKIRIEAEIGASVREAFDIDKSKHVLGKLKHGDERYFLKKKTLNPPPISVDESDDDDECVAVIRYKIILKETDVTNNAVGRDAEGRLTGWISDRSRLADEPYKILREL